MSAWDLALMLKNLQQFNREYKNRNSEAATNDSSVVSSTCSSIKNVATAKQLTSTAVKELYETGVSRVLASCSNTAGMYSPIPLDGWSQDHLTHRDWYRLSIAGNSFAVKEHGQLHSICFMHALHQLSTTTQCSMTFVLESLYLALDDLGYLIATRDASADVRSPTTRNSRKFISHFLRRANYCSTNILLKWYQEQYSSCEENPIVKRPRTAASSNNRNRDYLAAFASKNEEEDEDLSVMYTTALLSLPWILMRCAYMSDDTENKPGDGSKKIVASKPKTNPKSLSSSVPVASSTSSSRKRTRDATLMNSNQNSVGNDVGDTSIRPETFLFDVFLDEKWKTELLYIVAHTYVVHFYRQREKKLPSWKDLETFLRIFRKTWYSPMMQEIELQGFSALQEMTLVFYGMDTLSSYQLHRNKDFGFKINSCYLSNFGDKFLSVKTPWKTTPYGRPNQAEIYNDSARNIKCIEGLHPRLMLKVLCQPGYVSDSTQALVFLPDGFVYFDSMIIYT